MRRPKTEVGITGVGTVATESAKETVSRRVKLQKSGKDGSEKTEVGRPESEDGRPNEAPAR